MSENAGAGENPWAGQGSVLLDIGGDVGALIVAMPAEMLDVEVEIRPVGGSPGEHDHARGPDHEAGHAHPHEEGHHPHVAVVDRPVEGGLLPSLVYPELVEGTYELYVKETSEVRLVATVRGGQVTSEDWPA